jgi:hypothetical protein
MATTKHTACAHPRAATRPSPRLLSNARRTPPPVRQLRADHVFHPLPADHAPIRSLAARAAA